LRKEAEARAEKAEREVERLTQLAESDEQRLIAANEEIAALRLELEERSSSPPKKRAGSPRSSAPSSTTTESAGSAGTRKTARSSKSQAAARGRSPRTATRRSQQNP
jgi:hypothetical protein